MIGGHDWDHTTELCKVCGITKQGYLNDNSYGAAFCTTPTIKMSSDPCCGMPAIVYMGNEWFCESCGKKDDSRKLSWYDIPEQPDFFQAKEVPRENIDKTCVCGALHTSKVNEHSPWCNVRTIK